MGHRDLKNSSRSVRSSATRRRGGSGGGVMMGVIIGLIIGVAAVVGVVMYFNKAGTPFSNLKKMEQSEASAGMPQASRHTQILSPGMSIHDANSSDGPVEAPRVLPSPAAVRSVPASAASAKPPASDKDKNNQRFDFYKILPGQVDAMPAEAQQAPGNDSVGNGSTKPYLQVAAFQNQDDADNLKAKLALLGVEATIQSAEIPGKGLVHRVRVGPLASKADVDRVRSLLRQNGLEPTGGR